MEKKNITPNPQQPVDRVASGQLPSALAELSEEAIGKQAQALMDRDTLGTEVWDSETLLLWGCSYDGDDE
ncbi:DUF5837 family protein [Spirulina subsalsa FACHB-351]|uniref:DUF5837 family protein n=1 Tax=Spirulina subsalsa FACHB-351 TaxID=234711 RepID=A0ABT3L244_9CYAN|nr:DUF5837 family cyanobactin class RiPP [Spirulina subsalsa]MCW6035566.1 DUF5837 family protein [Spirulina subsalsa FACHB-351]